ncbi:hypothetical protein [Bacillus alkalicellulosilyticus]|uniref:hypothetical protein n=1 Tax=Alkalihalobacterium alkalicellulosilyticum TaxID=1912214 RepID=UPI001116D9C2|nr:hypothetical protein [Bacillus alkalicellulosilyticus]
MFKWAAQSISPDDYINETITVHSFSVKNHPLEDIYDTIENPVEGVYVEVFVWNHDVIGGVSSPIAKEMYRGGYHQLDNMPSLMEIEGIDYPTWHSEWEAKYK